MRVAPRSARVAYQSAPNAMASMNDAATPSAQIMVTRPRSGSVADAGREDEREDESGATSTSSAGGFCSVMSGASLPGPRRPVKRAKPVPLESPRQSMKPFANGLFLAVLLSVEFVLFRGFVAREIAPEPPRNNDQSVYLQEAYRIHRQASDEGVGRALRAKARRPGRRRLPRSGRGARSARCARPRRVAPSRLLHPRPVDESGRPPEGRRTGHYSSEAPARSPEQRSRGRGRTPRSEERQGTARWQMVSCSVGAILVLSLIHI